MLQYNQRRLYELKTTTMTNTEIVKEYLAKYPNLPNLTLAKLIYKENSGSFISRDAVYYKIRYYTGKMGEKNRGRLERGGNTEFIKTELGKLNPFVLPESDADTWEPYHLPKSATKILVLSDVHLPYHDVKALQLAIQYGKEHQMNTVLLNGDILDFYMLSKYMKDVRKRNLPGELETLRQFISYIKQEIPNVKIYYKLGNHEERYQIWMFVKAPELLGMPEFEIETLIQSRAAGVEVISDKRIVYAGKLPILHGHEIQGSGTVNPARTLFLKTKQSALKGHSHISSENNGKTLSGEIITTWSTGCLCDQHPEYARINDWNLGFADVRVSDNGDFRVSNKRIYNGQIL